MNDVAAELRARKSRFHEAVAAEVACARAKFPGNRHQYVALAEEVGEVAKALIEGESPEAIYAECVQVAAMAQRVAEDGDDDFPGYEPAEALDEAASLVEALRSPARDDEDGPCPGCEDGCERCDARKYRNEPSK